MIKTHKHTAHNLISSDNKLCVSFVFEEINNGVSVCLFERGKNTKPKPSLERISAEVLQVFVLNSKSEKDIIILQENQMIILNAGVAREVWKNLVQHGWKMLYPPPYAYGKLQ